MSPLSPTLLTKGSLTLFQIMTQLRWMWTQSLRSRPLSIFIRSIWRRNASKHLFALLVHQCCALSGNVWPIVQLLTLHIEWTFFYINNKNERLWELTRQYNPVKFMISIKVYFFQNVELFLKDTVSSTPCTKMQRIAGCDLDHKDRRSADI